jgi:hypothetical protein
MNTLEPALEQPALDRIPHRHFQTPARIGGSRAGGVLPRGLIGMLLLVAAAERIMASRQGEFLDPVRTSWVFAARAAKSDAPACDVLCLGDSLAKHSLVPRVIEAATGRHAFNLAVAAGPAPITYFVFRRALDGGARPSAVVFDFKPSLLAGGPRYRVREWQEVLTFGESLDLLRHSGGSLAAELLVGALLPSLRSRHEIRSNVLAAIRGELASLADLNESIVRNWTVNDGANLATPRPGFTGSVVEAQHLEYLSDRFAPHRVNAAYARRTVVLAAERGIRAYLLVPPFAPALHARRQSAGTEAKYNRFIRSLQEMNPKMTVLDARDSCYPASVFVDPIHLDVHGAVTLSTDVASVLRADLEPGRGPSISQRWVHLPAFRTVSPAFALEDFEQSKHHVRTHSR